MGFEEPGAIIHGCTLKNNSYVHVGAVISNNAIVGENSVVEAGAFVTDDTVIPSNQVPFFPFKLSLF